IKAGIPVVASIAFTSNQLPGFLFRSTAGHLLVIVGFTKNGDVVVDDPASTSDQAVQHVYDRTHFERDWLASTGGTVYLIHPASVPFPANLPGQPANW
ncbi:MAG: C39 family peptidase, partial [Actinobacteria bacterium]|nr:C39 family peptidase [Actinomycetota bacterium]